MKGRVIKSFAGTHYGSYGQGDIIDIPTGVDWVQAGLVEVIEEEKIETAMIAPGRTAVKKTAKPRKPKVTE